MLNKRINKSAAARLAVFLSLFMQAAPVTAAEATEPAPILPSDIGVISRSRLEADTPASTYKGGSNNVLLNGGVSVFQPHSLIGKWNGHIHKFGRHPKLNITHCQGGQIAGTYKGIFGTFPVNGRYDEATGNISIDVNFSSSVLTRLKRLRSGHGIIEANIQNGLLVGQASIPDLGPKTVRWEAVKDTKDGAVNSEKAE